MSYFAKLDNNNIVLTVNVVDEKDVDYLSFPESEPIGIAYLNSVTEQANWKQTSDTGAFRYNFACSNYTYDPIADAFIPPQPYPSWVLNTSTYTWEPPNPPGWPPNDGQDYVWDEQTKSWVLIVV